MKLMFTGHIGSVFTNTGVAEGTEIGLHIIKLPKVTKYVFEKKNCLNTCLILISSQVNRALATKTVN